MATKSQRVKRRNARTVLQAAAPEGPLRIEGELPVEFKAAAGDQKLATFGMTLYTGGKMRPRGFSTPVVMDLATTTVASGTRPFLANHDPTQPVGHGDITVDANSIKATGMMSVASASAEAIKTSAANGFPWKSSIGADVGKLDFIEAGKQVTVNNRKFNGPIYVARNNVVYEGSFVTLAGDNRSSATVAATLGESAMNPFEKWLQAKGIELATLSDAAKGALQAAFDAEELAKKKPEEKPPVKVKAARDDEEEDSPDPIAALRAEQAAEVTRVKGIKKLFAAGGYNATTIKTSAGEFDLEAHAIAEGWTPEAAELYALRAARPAPAIHSQSHDTDATLQAMQGAMMLRAGLALDSKHWGSSAAVALGLPAWTRRSINDDVRQRVMEASHQFWNMSMVDMCREACRLDGRTVNSNRAEMIQASFSGAALTSIFTTSVNAKLLVTFMESGDSTKGWTSETDVPNFMTNDRIQLAKGSSLAKLPRGASADHVTRSDRAESYKIARYARQFVVDEQDVIDDRLNALQDMPKEMGLAAARLRPDLVYAILFANAALNADSVALFHSSHSNTDTSAALAATTLKTGITKVGLQTDNNVNLSIEATHLIVPKTLDFTAKELMNSSLVVVTGTTDLVRGDANVLKSALQVVSDSRLDNGVTDPSTGTSYSGDTNDWFLAAAGANTIEVGYLAGTGRVPRVRSFVLDKGTYGMGWDVSMDIGAKALDYRGLYRGQG